MPKVSVIVPVYNVERYLDRCINSLVNQTLTDIEIILVDDGSPDRCPQMCDDWARRDSRIKVVHKQNAGLGMACNSGIDAATGDYIAFCDSDDWVDPDMYATMYAAATTHNADAVYTGLKRVNSHDQILGLMPHPTTDYIYTDNDISKLICDIICSEPHLRYDHGIQVSAKVVLYKRSHISNNGLRFVSEREYPSEDLIFNISVLNCAKTAVVLNGFYYNYFVNDDSITTTLKKDRFDKIIKSAQLISSIIDNQGIHDTETRINRFIIGEARTQARLIIHSNESTRRKKQLIRDLSRNKHLIASVRKYPVHLMHIKHRIMLQLLLSGNYRLLNFIYKFV